MDTFENQHKTPKSYSYFVILKRHDDVWENGGHFI